MRGCIWTLCRTDWLPKVQVVASGVINAVVFWFDLHLDAQESLTTGKP